MTLENWLENKWLKRHQTSAQEISGLFDIVERDLTDARNPDISPDWRLSMAYSASLQCATSALFAFGYRTSGEGHHERTINSLKFTISAPENLITQLNRIRNKRIKISYDRAGTTSEQEVKEVIKFAGNLKELVQKWLKKSHPELSK